MAVETQTQSKKIELEGAHRAGRSQQAGGLTIEQGGAPEGVASTVDPRAIASEDPGVPVAPQNPTDPAAAQADQTAATTDSAATAPQTGAVTDPAATGVSPAPSATP